MRLRSGWKRCVRRSSSSHIPFPRTQTRPCKPQHPTSRPALSLRTWTRPITLLATSYTLVTLLDLSFLTLLPLFLFASLALTPRGIGFVMLSMGLLDVLLSWGLFEKLMGRFGSRARFFVVCNAGMVGVWAGLPLVGWAGGAAGLGWLGRGGRRDGVRLQNGTLSAAGGSVAIDESIRLTSTSAPVLVAAVPLLHAIAFILARETHRHHC